jgi:hypothetical protein
MFIYNIVGSTGNYINGETPKIKIMKVSASQWYDFSDDTFKASNVIQSTYTLTENTTGQFYHYTFNPPVTETTPDIYNITVDNTGTYADHQVETIVYDNVNYNHSSDTVTVVTNLDKTGYGVTSGTVTIQGTKTTLDALNDTSTTTVTAAVWNASTSTYVTGGSMGKK